MTAQAQQKGRQKHQMHGLYALKGALMRVGYRVVDGRTSTGKALAKWRAELIRDIGGDPSTQESAIIDLIVKARLMLDSVDAWLLRQPTLVNARKKSLFPVLMQRQTLADSLVRYLTALGLARRAKDVDGDLQAYVREKYGNRNSDGQPAKEPTDDGKGEDEAT
jgi:hypothetical protein